MWKKKISGEFEGIFSKASVEDIPLSYIYYDTAEYTWTSKSIWLSQLRDMFKLCKPLEFQSLAQLYKILAHKLSLYIDIILTFQCLSLNDDGL